MQHPNIETCLIETLIPYKNNARTHSSKQIQQIANSIKRFGFTNPVLISDKNEIIAGHGRVMAAKELKMIEVPVLRLSHLSAEERRAYILADNKLAENAGWDNALLLLELEGLLEMDFDTGVIGFSTTEIDLIFNDNYSNTSDDTLDEVPPIEPALPVTRLGDLWQLGKQKLLCGDARVLNDIKKLCGEQSISLMFTDPPYNVKIDGHVSGLGQHKHREFAVASGEMNQDQFITFLRVTLLNAASQLKDGAIAYVCMDWRHMQELQQACEVVFDELKNLCVWNKTNGGMGTFYRSKHELVFAYKKGRAPHTNNFGLGDGGRYRTNVWDYAGANTLGFERDEELAMHPRVKPVALVADAIRDCSNHNETVLDIFGGSGSTVIDAEKTGRMTRVLEYDPLYCDVIIRRFEKLTGINVVHCETGRTFTDISQQKSDDINQAYFKPTNLGAAL